MARRYADRVAVDALSDPAASDPAAAALLGPEDAAAPRAFLWRRRRYRVRTVLQRWIEVGAWWRTTDAADQEYQIWRVEAGAEYPPGSPVGHFDLCRHQGTGQWFLIRTFD